MVFLLKLILFSGLLALVYTRAEAGSYAASTCAKGQRQSPINIKLPTAKQVKETDIKMKKAYTKGHVMEVENEDGAVLEGEIEDGASLKVGGGLMEGEKYIFDDFQFHWGAGGAANGSDHHIGGKIYAAEMHLMHYNAKYANFEAAVASGDPKALMFIAVLFQEATSKNKALDPILKNVKYVVNPGEELVGAKVNLAKIVFNGEKRVIFGHYLGSLTKDGCEEVVMWNVKLTPNPISKDQLKEFTKLKAKNGQPLMNNYRGTRPLNGRAITYYSVYPKL